MTIRNKVLYSFGLTCAIFVIIAYTIAHIFLLGKFAKIEEQNVHLNLQQLSHALNNELRILSNDVNDWANWDDTYHFIETQDTGYIRSNLLDDTFINLQLNLIFYVNSTGKVVYGRVFDLVSHKGGPNPDIQKQILAYKVLLQSSELDRTQTGIILLPQMPVLIAAHPILTSQKKGPSQGTLVMGRFLNQMEITKLAQMTHLPIKITRYSKLPNGFQLSLSASTQTTPIRIRTLNAKEITGYSLIKDITNKPALIASIKLPRTIYREGLISIFYFITVLIGVSVILLLLVLLFLKREVITRLDLYNKYINSVVASNDLSIRLPIKGNDELTASALVINRMMSNLEQFHFKLQESHQQLMDIIEFLPDATYVIDRNHIVVAWNRAMELLTGLKKAEVIGQNPLDKQEQPMLMDLILAEEAVIKRYYKTARKKNNVVFAEKNITISGKQKTLWITASPLFNKDNEIMGAIESIRDISERKEAEAELIYLSQHDQLTGLYNRAYFEEEIRRLDSGRYPVVGIIMCDVDGLKLINDSLGHPAGDILLQAAARTIKKAFRDNDIIARVGGDEFAVLLPRGDSGILESTGRRIQQTLADYNKNNPQFPLSISVGWSCRKETTVSLKAVFEEADNKMYREKLHRTQSAHSAIVQTLMKTLNARDFITEGHGDRLKDLVLNLSRHLGLSIQKINDIALLAQFHDIGKVGIPDSILFKQGPLDPEEKKTMQRHAEIGYNIAKSAQELQHISDWILLHHEWWNGNGYPRGLKGTEIPLECRILSIIDAFDAMTNDRPYRKALSRREAIQELQKCAGIQFDPNLVTEFIKIITDLPG